MYSKRVRRSSPAVLLVLWIHTSVHVCVRGVCECIHRMDVFAFMYTNEIFWIICWHVDLEPGECSPSLVAFVTCESILLALLLIYRTFSVFN